MAIWQHSFTLIPNSVLGRASLSLDTYLDKDGFLDDEACWLTQPTKVDLFNEIEQVLPRNKSWTNDMMLFGDENSNRFEVYTGEDNLVTAVSFRIDYTSDYDNILRFILNFIEMNNLAIIDEKLKLVDNDFAVIKTRIENSEHRAFYEKLRREQDAT